jgi:hypothetical protein
MGETQEICEVSVVVPSTGVFCCTRPVGHDGEHDNPAFLEAL